MALVLTRVAGESIRITDCNLNLNFDIKIVEVKPKSVWVKLNYSGRTAECDFWFDDKQKIFDGVITFHKGHRGRGQVRCVFDMPAHINIVRTELLK